ncbi:MAG: NotI family restriction endonuclease [Armatimonadota bacterium]
MPRTRERFGIGEWYGKSFVALSQAQRRRLAVLQLARGKRKPIPCPFQSIAEAEVPCGKAGGVCSLRLYEEHAGTGEVRAASGDSGRLRTTCPKRFQEGGRVYRWVGEAILGNSSPLVLGEIGFLEHEETGQEVARIDNVLVAKQTDKDLAWCALEIQAVYFQGAAMSREWGAIRDHPGPGLPFPTAIRRPDYRSSGPKRLMPQLQVKVPWLRRWGKKMAVVVDEDFFRALGKMDDVGSVSNCDIAWFVVRYEERGPAAGLQPAHVRLTTLERAVEGLTAARPVTMEAFELRIRQKIDQLS